MQNMRDSSSERSCGSKSESDDDDDFDIDSHVNYPQFYRSDDDHDGEEDDEDDNDNDSSSDEEDGPLRIALMTSDDKGDEDDYMCLKEWSKPVPTRFSSMEIEGIFQARDPKVGRLVRLLKSESQGVRVWKVISITDNYDENHHSLSHRDRAAFLALFGLAMNCTENLSLHVKTVDSKLFRALRSLGQAKNLEDFALRLKPSQFRTIRKKDTKEFADGLSMSESLKSLSLLVAPRESGEDESYSSTDFLSAVFDGMKRKNSPQPKPRGKVSRLSLADDVALRKAEADGTPRRAIENLSLSVEMSEHSFVKFGEYLGDADCCKLKTLNLHGSSFPPFPPEAQSVTNETVSWLALYSCKLSSQSLPAWCALFPCLHELRLDRNWINDLSPLDPLLLGDSSRLQRLSISNNSVGEGEFIEFVGKLPRMKSLCSIEIAGNPFLESATAIEYFLDTIVKNKSLSSVHVGHLKKHKEHVKIDREKEMAAWHWMNVNGGGRRGIQIGSAGRPIPVVLWPLILSRCLTRKYSRGILGKLPSETNMERVPTDVLFSVLLENANIFDKVPP